VTEFRRNSPQPLNIAMRMLVLVAAFATLSQSSLAQGGTRAATPSSAMATPREQMVALLAKGRTDTTVPQADMPAVRAMAVRWIGNPFAMILKKSDSLRLTPAQATRLTMLNVSLEQGLEQRLSSLAQYMATLPREYDADRAWDRVRTAYAGALDYRLAVLAPLPNILTPTQMAALPGSVTMMLDPRCNAKWAADPSLGVAAC
jgi:hypothetical protein